MVSSTKTNDSKGGKPTKRNAEEAGLAKNGKLPNKKGYNRPRNNSLVNSADNKDDSDIGE